MVVMITEKRYICKFDVYALFSSTLMLEVIHNAKETFINKIILYV